MPCIRAITDKVLECDNHLACGDEGLRNASERLNRDLFTKGNETHGWLVELSLTPADTLIQFSYQAYPPIPQLYVSIPCHGA